VTDRRPSRWRLAFAGVVAVAAALAAGELAAGVVAGIPSPILSIGRQVVALQPPGAKDFVANLFGTADKIALQVVIVAAALAIGAGVGLLAARRSELASTLIAIFAALGFIASIGDPDSVIVLAAAAAAIEAFVGMTVLNRLVPLAVGPARAPARGTAAMPDWTRRTLLLRGGAVAIGSFAAGTFGRILLEGQRTPTTSGTLPSPQKTATLPAGADLTVRGLTPIVVKSDDFYRIDTALIPPDVNVDTWHLKVTGLVDHPIDLTFDQLIQLPIVEQYVTIACVSNQVGGNLVGNALWRGVPLRTVLSMAGVHPNATQLVGRAVDGFTVGMPTSWVMDGSREPLIAIGMNGRPLPRAHGYPARLIVPGLYGYVSATKWLTELNLTTLEAFDAYWVPLGWAKEAPILTQSRIELPRLDVRLTAGQIPVAGVAWAPDRGIRKVEVAIDGVWHDTELSVPISDATWVQWLYQWDATPGLHTVEVRATDGTGVVQTADHSNPAPDGARGHHTIQVQIA
jgi:DMSO/TMAO reductase YedYZ molybdopterin-dependent catalytic subunit